MSWSIIERALVVSAVAATAAAGTQMHIAGAPASTAQATVRGYTLAGELLLFPAAEQALPQGWSLIPEGTLAQGANVIKLAGQSEVIATGDALVSLMSQAMAPGEGQLVLANDGGGSLGLGDLALSFSKDGWWVISNSADWSGRPVFELTETSRQIYPRGNDGEFTITGELRVSSTVFKALGVSNAPAPIVGVLTVVASPFWNPAQPLVRNAPAPAGTTGPDVIVSTIGSSLTKNGTVGTITAYSYTTVSCNIGTTDAIWLSNVNQHPVIGSQLYRLRTVNGTKRFEQIGMSWLKHGFCAADAPSCGSPYTPNGSCDWLGEFATDTYSSGLNGDQGNLGARSEIQAWTGAYPYPYINQGCSSNAICKRVQVQNADLDPALNVGAQYWGEVVYITTDEALNSVRFNNYSHRGVTAGAQSNTPPGSNLAFNGSTIAQVAAIQEWAVNDTGVQVSNGDVPNDGRFVLASKVTDLGGGQFHYEYALFNLDSDRSAQGFSVPLIAGASVSNVEFHDVDYHSGEPYATTDWTPATTPGTSQSWVTQTYATNVNANALRWSTVYNFRFDSNQPPQPGAVTVTLFKPGTGSTITLLADVPNVCADSDGDGTNDCIDGCPNDPLKIAPGQCGCGNLDTDTDGDGVANCVDGCPNDPTKIVPGICGCGVPDTDSDGDGYANCVDGCPSDSTKHAPGVCGCGVPDVDTDGDNHFNCVDNCPNYYNPAQADGDQDGVGNVCDNCPQSSNANQADADLDAVGNVCDNCPSFSNPQQTDSDGDGSGDGCDGCPNDPNKVSPGACGCGVVDTDTDGDGVADCLDNCDNIANPTQADCDLDGIGDVCELANGTAVDTNANGIPDNCEACPNIIVYCTAGTSTHGCNAAMSASGTPSVAAASGFTLSCTSVEGQKSTLIFYGINGPKASVWAAGSTSVLCVKAPTQRQKAINSGGTTNACDGAIAFDWLAYIAAHPSALGAPFAAGHLVNAQAWFRDPPAPSTTNLSNGVQFTTCP